MNRQSTRVVTIGVDELRELIRAELEAAMVQRAPSPPSPARRMYLTLAEAEEETGYSPDTLRRWIREGRLRAERASPRGHYRIRPEDLEAALQPTSPRRPVDVTAIAGSILHGRR